jgi:hypothetical protein
MNATVIPTANFPIWRSEETGLYGFRRAAGAPDWWTAHSRTEQEAAKVRDGLMRRWGDRFARNCTKKTPEPAPYADGYAGRTVTLFNNLCGGGPVVADSKMSLRNPNVIRIREVPEDVTDGEVAQRMAQTIVVDGDGQVFMFKQLNSNLHGLRRLAGSERTET